MSVCVCVCVSVGSCGLSLSCAYECVSCRKQLRVCPRVCVREWLGGVERSVWVQRDAPGILHDFAERSVLLQERHEVRHQRVCYGRLRAERAGAPEPMRPGDRIDEKETLGRVSRLGPELAALTQCATPGANATVAPRLGLRRRRPQVLAPFARLPARRGCAHDFPARRGVRVVPMLQENPFFNESFELSSLTGAHV